MKLCISTLVCPQWNLGKIVESAKKYGIGGIDFRGLGSEIDITGLAEFDQNLDKTLSLLSAAGLSMPCLNTSVTLLSPSPQRWEAMLEEAQRYARLARRSGCTYLRIFGGIIPKELTSAQGLLMAQRHLRQITKICQAFGCVPLLETHDHWAASPHMLELIHEFNPAEVGVLWDLEHPWRAGESPADTARALHKFIRHIHIKDTRAVDGKRQQLLIGEGELPLADCAAAIRSIDYSGWFCLETEKRWDGEAPEPEVSIPQFVKYMWERWNQ